MSFLDNLKSLFSAKAADHNNHGAASTYPTETYQGFQITPAPQRDGSQYRVHGHIQKGEQSHTFIRADLLSNADECATETMRKAKLTIDQLGDGIFD